MRIEDAARRLAETRTHVLSSPVRLAIMLLLVARGGIEFNDLKKTLNLTSGNLWSHLKRLEKEGLVKLRYRFSFAGPRLVVEPTGKGVQETMAYIEGVRTALSGLGKE